MIDESLDPGSVLGGEQSLRLTFLGGYGSGVATAFDPIEYGVLEFHARVDHVSDDMALMGLFNFADTDTAGSTCLSVQVHPGTDNYVMESSSVVDSGVPVVYGEYVKFDVYFDTATDAATLYINDMITDAVDVPFQNASDGIVALSSRVQTDPGGSGRWYLDDISIIPEPMTGLLMALGGLLVTRRRR